LSSPLDLKSSLPFLHAARITRDIPSFYDMTNELRLKVAKRRKATNVFYTVTDQFLTCNISFALGY